MRLHSRLTNITTSTKAWLYKQIQIQYNELHLQYTQWCSRKYLGTGAVQNISMVLFLEREH